MNIQALYKPSEALLMGVALLTPEEMEALARQAEQTLLQTRAIKSRRRGREYRKRLRGHRR